MRLSSPLLLLWAVRIQLSAPPLLLWAVRMPLSTLPRRNMAQPIEGRRRIFPVPSAAIVSA